MKKLFVCTLLCALLLAACGKAPAAETQPSTEAPAVETTLPADTTPTETAPAAQDITVETQPEFDRPAAMPVDTENMDFTVEGTTESLPAKLWLMPDCAITIPAENWKYAQGIIYDQWTSTLNDKVSITIYHFEEMNRGDAVEEFVSRGPYLFEDTLGGGSAEDPITGSYENMRCSFFCTQWPILVAWEYPVEAAEGFGSRLIQMAKTFS